MGQRLHVKYDAAKSSRPAASPTRSPIPACGRGSSTRSRSPARRAPNDAGGCCSAHRPQRSASRWSSKRSAFDQFVGLPVRRRDHGGPRRHRPADLARDARTVARYQPADDDCGRRRHLPAASSSEAAAVVVLFAFAQMLEARTLEHARGAISALLDLTPAEALVRDAAGERPRRCRSVSRSARLIVDPARREDSARRRRRRRARARSTRRRSPANRCRPTRRRATRCSPARSTGAARSTSASRGCGATRRSRASSIWSSGRRRSARRRRRSSSASRACTRRR